MHWSLVARLLLYLLIFASLYWLMPVELLYIVVLISFRENMGEGGNQLIPENVHTNPTNGSQSPFLGAGRATTAIWHRTKNHDPPTQL
jgi:ABC-type uncharacterized transport system YnjBCD substrate-binding protein